MNSEKEYIFYQFENSYEILKLSLLGDFLTDNKKELNKHCEVMLHRIFPEKSREQISSFIKTSKFDCFMFLKVLLTLFKICINHF